MLAIAPRMQIAKPIMTPLRSIDAADAASERVGNVAEAMGARTGGGPLSPEQLEGMLNTTDSVSTSGDSGNPYTKGAGMSPGSLITGGGAADPTARKGLTVPEHGPEQAGRTYEFRRGFSGEIDVSPGGMKAKTPSRGSLGSQMSEEVVFDEEDPEWSGNITAPRPDSSATDEIHKHNPIGDHVAACEAEESAQAMQDSAKTKAYSAATVVGAGAAGTLGTPLSGLLFGAGGGLWTGLNTLVSDAERKAQLQQCIAAGAKSGVDDQIEGSDYVPSDAETQRRLDTAGITSSTDPRTGNPNPAADDMSGDGRPKLTTAQKLTSRIDDQLEIANRELVDVLTLKVQGEPIRG